MLYTAGLFLVSWLSTTHTIYPLLLPHLPRDFHNWHARIILVHTELQLGLDLCLRLPQHAGKSHRHTQHARPV
jgi:hypothetical protein